jgi:formylglycine-generating enzyme required for sulfatase activity
LSARCWLAQFGPPDDHQFLPHEATIVAPPPPRPTFASEVAQRMVAIPAGSFKMRSPPGEAGRDGGEGPQHMVSIAAFEIGRTQVTRGEYKAFVSAFARLHACRTRPSNECCQQ